VLDEAWLPPDSGWPEPDELRAEHVRLRRASASAAEARAALEEAYEAEDEAKRAAYREAVAAETEPDLATVTPEYERVRELRGASARARAAYEAFCDQVDHTLGVLAENGADLLAGLDQTERDLADEIRVMVQALTTLRRRQGESVWLRNWLARSSGSNGPVMLGVDLIQYSALPSGTVAEGPGAREAWVDEQMRESHDPPAGRTSNRTREQPLRR
jgi:hypothetical protein